MSIEQTKEMAECVRETIKVSNILKTIMKNSKEQGGQAG